MNRSVKGIKLAVPVAALLWFYMFSTWTQGRPNFWLVMSCAAVILTGLAIFSLPAGERFPKVEKPIFQLLGGIVLALALWGIFWVGDKASSWLFDFARPEVDAVYSIKQGLPVPVIGALLLLLIGPAEEFFWRGFVQNTLASSLKGRYPQDYAFLLTAAIYALVHIWSFNFMLIMAALVAGLVWGFIYRLCPKALPALIISHALWDVLIFIILPI